MVNGYGIKPLNLPTDSALSGAQGEVCCDASVRQTSPCVRCRALLHQVMKNISSSTLEFALFLALSDDE